MLRQHIKGYLPSLVVLLAFGAVSVYGYIKVSTLSQQVDILSTDLITTKATLARLSLQANGLLANLSNTQQNIDAVKNQVGGVAQTINSISGTVGNLQKLSEVDPELLKKYSKVYFLSENYMPAHLVTIPTEFTYSSTQPEQYLSEAWPYLQNMFASAKLDGVPLYVKSGFRSFKEQKSLKTSYTVVYGAGTANSFSADQGYSEHQLGTTVDFVSTGANGNLDGFDKTQAYQWLLTNGYRYGFILSYPKGNSYYVYEPWHWRFVGVKLATFLHDSGQQFYDLDQRDIDKFLANTFDL